MGIIKVPVSWQTLIPQTTSALRCVASPRKHITRSAVSLSYKIFGEEDVSEPEKVPLFILHGMLGMKKHWESAAKTMLNMTKRPVVIVDQRNHGDSPHVSSHRLEELAADVMLLLEKLSVKKACLVGHSMGGKTIMCVSLMAPQLVAGLLVVDVSPISSPPHLTEYLPKVLTAMKTVEFHPKKVNKARKQVKSQLKDLITDDVLMRTVLSNIKITSKGTIGWTCNLDVLMKHFKYITSFPRSMKTKKYNGPTLFLGGRLSDYIPPDDLTYIRQIFPQAVVHYVPSAGHNVQVDDPKSFIEYVIAFCRRLEE